MPSGMKAHANTLSLIPAEQSGSDVGHDAVCRLLNLSRRRSFETSDFRPQPEPHPVCQFFARPSWTGLLGAPEILQALFPPGRLS